MRIGIIGAGNLGTALAKRLRPHGHEMMFSYSRDPLKLAATAAGLGVQSGTPTEAVAFAEVIALTVPWAAVPDALAEAGSLAGRTLWDCTNPLKPDMSGLVIGTTTSGGEEVARLAVGAIVIKGIPPFAELLNSGDARVAGHPAGVFVAGPNGAAKAKVTDLLTQLPTIVTDAGDLDAARLIEPAMMLLVRLAYAQGIGPRISFNLTR